MRISDWSSDVCSSDLSGGRHDPRPCNTSTRADSPGTRRPESGLPRNLIFTGTRWTTRTKLPVALSAGIRLKAEQLPGARIVRKSVVSGKEWVRPSRLRWSPYRLKKKHIQPYNKPNRQCITHTTPYMLHEV